MTKCLVGVGLAIGLLASLSGSRLLSKFLYGLSAMDGLVFAGVSVLLTLGRITRLLDTGAARDARGSDGCAALRVVIRGFTMEIAIGYGLSTLTASRWQIATVGAEHSFGASEMAHQFS